MNTRDTPADSFRTRPRVVAAVLMAFACGLVGCNEAGRGIRPEVARGFRKSTPRLFVASQRLGRLLEHLGYDPEEYSHSCDHSSDGTSLRCWNYGRSRAVVIRKGRAARVLATPEGAFLDDQDNVVAWYGRNAGDHKITFRNGKVLRAPGFRLDSAGRFFGWGGDYYDYAAGKRRTAPIRLAAVANPEKVLVTSQLQGILAGIYVADRRAYVMVRANTGRTPDHLVCEEYERRGSAFALKRRFEVRCPTRRAAHIVPMDFNPQRLRFLMKADREMPARGPVWYTYDVKTDRLEKIGTFHGYAGFLDPNIFDRAMEAAH